MIRCERELVRELVRKKGRFFIAASLAALALRLFLVFRFPAIVDDSRLYANIAENWLQHGVYGVTNSGVITPTPSPRISICHVHGRDYPCFCGRFYS